MDSRVARARHRLATLVPTLASGVGLTRAGTLVIVGAAGLWVAARIVAGVPMYLTAYGLALAVPAGYLLAPRRLRIDAVRSGVTARMVEGDLVEITVSLRATGRVPALVLEEHLPEALGTAPLLAVSGMRAGEQRDHRYVLRPSRRGAFPVGPLVARASDPLGIHRRRIELLPATEVVVHPRLTADHDQPRTRSFDDPPVRPPVSRPWPSGFDLAGLRDYARGDDLRRIVWRASARTGRLMVREAEQGVTDRVVVLVDTHAGVHHHVHPGDGSPPWSDSLEAGVRVAASVAVDAIRSGLAVSLLTNDADLVTEARGASRQIDLLDGFARVTQSEAPLDAALTRFRVTGGRQAHLVVVSPSVDPRAAAALRLVIDGSVSVTLVHLDWGGVDATPGIVGMGVRVVTVRPSDPAARPPVSRTPDRRVA